MFESRCRGMEPLLLGPAGLVHQSRTWGKGFVQAVLVLLSLSKSVTDWALLQI